MFKQEDDMEKYREIEACKEEKYRLPLIATSFKSQSRIFKSQTHGVALAGSHRHEPALTS